MRVRYAETVKEIEFHAAAIRRPPTQIRLYAKSGLNERPIRKSGTTGLITISRGINTALDVSLDLVETIPTCAFPRSYPYTCRKVRYVGSLLCNREGRPKSEKTENRKNWKSVYEKFSSTYVTRGIINFSIDVRSYRIQPYRICNDM